MSPFRSLPREKKNAAAGLPPLPLDRSNGGLKCEPGQKALTQLADCEMHIAVRALAVIRTTTRRPRSTTEHVTRSSLPLQVAWSSHTHRRRPRGKSSMSVYAHNEQPRTAAPLVRDKRPAIAVRHIEFDNGPLYTRKVEKCRPLPSLRAAYFYASSVSRWRPIAAARSLRDPLTYSARDAVCRRRSVCFTRRDRCPSACPFKGPSFAQQCPEQSERYIYIRYVKTARTRGTKSRAHLLARNVITIWAIRLVKNLIS